jgi:beta-phosphoglucomutase-like phosphatase (HAD superfamily)
VTIRAAIFDFDGLLLETEEPTFRSWAETYAEHGQELSLVEWSRTIGRVDHFDPWEELQRRLGRRLDPAVKARRKERRDELLLARDPCTGALAILAEAEHLGLATAVASSSSEEWVRSHLQRLELDRYIGVLSCFDGTVPAKPAPDLYLQALDRLGVDATEAVAFEDSHNGLLAAKAAGLFCVVVPTVMTGHMDFAAADLVVERLGEPALRELIESIGGRRG